MLSASVVPVRVRPALPLFTRGLRHHEHLLEHHAGVATHERSDENLFTNMAVVELQARSGVHEHPVQYTVVCV